MKCKYALFFMSLIFALDVSASSNSLMKVAFLNPADYGYVVDYPDENSAYVIYQQDDKSGKYWKREFAFDGKGFIQIRSEKLDEARFQQESDKVSKRVLDYVDALQKNANQSGVISTHHLQDSHGRSITTVISANENESDHLIHSFLEVRVNNVDVGTYKFVDDEAVEDVKTMAFDGQDYLLILSDGCGADVCNSFLRVLKY